MQESNKRKSIPNKSKSAKAQPKRENAHWELEGLGWPGSGRCPLPRGDRDAPDLPLSTEEDFNLSPWQPPNIFPGLGFFCPPRPEEGLNPHICPQFLISHPIHPPQNPLCPGSAAAPTRGLWPLPLFLTNYVRLRYPAPKGGLKWSSRTRPLDGNEHKFRGLKDTEMHSTDSTRRRGREKGGRKKKILRGQGKKI